MTKVIKTIYLSCLFFTFEKPFWMQSFLYEFIG